jgi:CheY-like chemotaxis protein
VPGCRHLGTPLLWFLKVVVVAVVDDVEINIYVAMGLLVPYELQIDTANTVADQVNMFLKNGFEDFISKPIDIRQMNVVLNKLVRDRRKAGSIPL